MIRTTLVFIMSLEGFRIGEAVPALDERYHVTVDFPVSWLYAYRARTVEVRDSFHKIRIRQKINEELKVIIRELCGFIFTCALSWGAWRCLIAVAAVVFLFFLHHHHIARHLTSQLGPL